MPLDPDADFVPSRSGRGRRSVGRESYFLAGGTRTVPAPGKVIQNILVARDAHLGYHPGDRLRLPSAARQAARHLTRGVSFTQQLNCRMARAIAAIEEAEPALGACIGCWGACSLLFSELRNVSGDERGGGGGDENSTDGLNSAMGEVRHVPMLLPSGRGGGCSSLAGRVDNELARRLCLAGGRASGVQGQGLQVVPAVGYGRSGSSRAVTCTLPASGHPNGRAPAAAGRPASAVDVAASRQADFCASCRKLFYHIL